ncbi:SMI1/KNR4 family protein [Paenibacillus sp. WLX1005]|uniref:SMI1/KNR4 family protein n=1 Tax=Paenibacillus sp. WLX1005 TaxID=3243766 RepID=UPI0039841669
MLEQYQDEQAQQKPQTDITSSNTVGSSEVNETEHHIDEIEQHYRICFPLDYLAFVRQSGDQAYQFREEGGQTDWEIHFSALDGQFIANNQAMVNDVNPDPQRIIPIAWSMSSGNNYLLDYRYNPAEPAVLLLEHEEAMVREDAEAEANSPEEAQQLLEGNVRKIADHFEAFMHLLKEQEAHSLSSEPQTESE